MTRPGPKPGPPGSQRTARLVVRVTPLELSAYQAAAGRAGVSMGEWVRGNLASDAEQRGYRTAMQHALAMGGMFAAGAESRYQREQTAYSLGWSESAATALEALEKFPDPWTAAAEKEHGG